MTLENIVDMLWELEALYGEVRFCLGLDGDGAVESGYTGEVLVEWGDLEKLSIWWEEYSG